ncbi:MAG: pyruvate formate lyase-activating protein [Lachnospiraceae bacterium]|nr:pyruvate formate lyase-activating protein [Lachnospiraceae bacterium]
MTGYIHSLESFGTVDGPGVRYVVFSQGCPMRCLYCHNPDTWHLKDGTPMETEEILKKLNRNRSFYTTGGLTVTGGEPLLQIDFLTELFTKAKEMNIHTCLDTSGILFDKNNEEKLAKFHALTKVTDLVMLDIKHMDENEHRKLTGHSNRNVFDFARFLEEQNIPVWIRHVVVPGITNQTEELEALGRYLSTLTNVEKLEILPYHALAVPKYENLDMEYPLKGVPQLTKQEAKEAYAIVEKTWKNM